MMRIDKIAGGIFKQAEENSSLWAHPPATPFSFLANRGLRVDGPARLEFSGPPPHKGGVAGGFSACRKPLAIVSPGRDRMLTCDSTRNPNLVGCEGQKTALSRPNTPATPFSSLANRGLRVDGPGGHSERQPPLSGYYGSETEQSPVCATLSITTRTVNGSEICQHPSEHAARRKKRRHRHAQPHRRSVHRLF